MECGRPWPAHAEQCVLRFDPADQRLAACAMSARTAPVADIEEGEVFAPSDGSTSMVAAVPNVRRLSLMPDDEVIETFRQTLMDRYIDRFPAVWDFEPRRWIGCASVRQLALICRAVSGVEDCLAAHGVAGSPGVVLWVDESRVVLREAYEHLRDVVSGVVADLSETMAEAVSA